MRVLHFITPSHLGGAELLVLRVAKAQVRYGVTSRVLCKRHARFEERARREGIEVCSAPISGKLNVRAVSILCSEIRRFQPDVVCTHLTSASLWGSLAARACEVPCISVVHGFTNALCYRFSPTLVCVSHEVAECMAAQRIPRANIRVVHNGIDPTPFCSGPRAELPLPPDAFCVGAVAHLARKKGFPELIEVALRMPEAHFVIVGEGEMRPQLTEMANGPLAGRLHLLGFRDDIPELMRRFDVFCLPSRREPFGLVLLEAMAAERPVVAFADGGVPEVVVHGETGLLAPPRDVAAMTDCLQRLQADPLLRREMGAAGRKRVWSEFTLEHTVQKLNAIFQEVTGRRCLSCRKASSL